VVLVAVTVVDVCVTVVLVCEVLVTVAVVEFTARLRKMRTFDSFCIVDMLFDPHTGSGTHHSLRTLSTLSRSRERKHDDASAAEESAHLRLEKMQHVVDLVRRALCRTG
jgi:hypothetical protein